MTDLREQDEPVALAESGDPIDDETTGHEDHEHDDIMQPVVPPTDAPVTPCVEPSLEP